MDSVFAASAVYRGVTPKIIELVAAVSPLRRRD